MKNDKKKLSEKMLTDEQLQDVAGGFTLDMPEEVRNGTGYPSNAGEITAKGTLGGANTRTNKPCWE